MTTFFKFELPVLFARNKDGSIQQWKVEVDGNRYRMIAGRVGGQMVESKWKVAKAKNVGQANATTDEEQAEAEAMSKWKKKIKTGYFEIVDDIDNPMTFIEPMLAHPLISKKSKKNKVTGEVFTEVEDRTHHLRFPVMVDRKYNGMRQVVSINGPFSRKGEPVKSAPHIWESVSPLFDDHCDLVLDGELYNHDYRHTLNELISIVRTNADHKITTELLAKSESVIRYYVYDGYGFVTKEGVKITEDTPCIERRNALKDLLNGYPYIVVVPHFIADSIEKAKELYGSFVEDGYEGAILRNSDAPYQHYRTNDLIKLKPFEDMEVVIIDIIDPGSGNWGGTGKTALVRMSNGKEFVATFKGSRETLIKILNEKDKWIGQKVTMTYNGWTGKGTPNYGQIDPNNCKVGDR